MRSIHDISQKETIDLLGKCWMTHDGMWFFHCLKEFGIETTNRVNKSAIQTLAPIEIKRIKHVLGMKDPIGSFDDFKLFFTQASKLMVPDFMHASFSFPEKNTMAWVFKKEKCFAYQGIKRLGAIDKYECGVLFRIKCWLDALEIENRFDPEIHKCNMHFNGNCCGNIHLAF
jgi:Family of unknown function (DUF6125)